MLLGDMDPFLGTDTVYAFADDLGSEGGFQGTTTGEQVLTRRPRSSVCAMKGDVFQRVRIPSGETAPAGSNRSRHGGKEMAEAFGVEGHEVTSIG